MANLINDTVNNPKIREEMLELVQAIANRTVKTNKPQLINFATADAIMSGEQYLENSAIRNFKKVFPSAGTLQAYNGIKKASGRNNEVFQFTKWMKEYKSQHGKAPSLENMRTKLTELTLLNEKHQLPQIKIVGNAGPEEVYAKWLTDYRKINGESASLELQQVMLNRINELLHV